MPYQVFALQWRPQNFDQIIGQDHVVKTLKNALEKKRLAYAYLFAGPRGVGKTSTARILAKALNCKGGPTTSPCQKCPFCLEITQGRSLDVIEIDGASNRGIDEIRALRENIKFSPSSGKFKIYIIDEVHMLTQEAFNALLKTLEEPPPFVKFIFATTQPHKVIPTILSRCQRLDFRRIPLMENIAQLEKIAEAEKIEIEKEVLFAIAKASDGSLRDAESVLDQLVSFSKEKVSLKDVISVLGLIEQDALFDFADTIIQKDPRGALSLLDNIVDAGKDLNVLLASLIEHFRNLMIIKVARADPKLIDLPEDICERLSKQAQAFSLEEIFTTFNILLNSQEIAKRMDSLRIPLEISLVKLTYDKKAAHKDLPVKERQPLPENRAHTVEKSKDDPIEQPTIQEEKEPPSSGTEQAIALDALVHSWQNIIENLSRIKISAATYLNEGSPIAIENNVLTIAFPKDYSLHKESLEKPANKAIIEKSISELMKAKIKVNFILSKEEAIRHNDEAEDDFLKSALQTFKGRVIKDR